MTRTLLRVGEHLSLVHRVSVPSTTSPSPCSPTCTATSSSSTSTPVTWVRVGQGREQGEVARFMNRRVLGEVGEVARLACPEDRRLLEAVTMVQLTILATSAASIPCMARLTLQGGAARGVGAGVVARILALAAREEGRATNSSTIGFFGGSTDEVEEVEVVERVVEETEEEETDPDFLDSITHEVNHVEAVYQILVELTLKWRSYWWPKVHKVGPGDGHAHDPAQRTHGGSDNPGQVHHLATWPPGHLATCHLATCHLTPPPGAATTSPPGAAPPGTPSPAPCSGPGPGRCSTPGSRRG